MKKLIISLIVVMSSFLIPSNIYAMNVYVTNASMTHTNNIINYSYVSGAQHFDAQRRDLVKVQTHLFKDGEEIDYREEYVWRIQGNGTTTIQGSFNISGGGNYGVMSIGISPQGVEYFYPIDSFTLSNVTIQDAFRVETAYWEGTVANYTEFDYLDPVGYVFDLYKNGVKVDSVESTSSSCDMGELMATYGTGKYRFLLHANTNSIEGTVSMGGLSRVYSYTAENNGSFSVSVNSSGGGNATANPTSGESDEIIEISAFPEDGYRFKEWQVIEGGVNIADKTKANTTFRIKDANVVIKAIFEKKDGTKPEKKEDKDDSEEKHHKHHSEHTPASWELNPNEKQQLVVSCASLGSGVSAGYQEQGAAAKAKFNDTTPAGWNEAFEFSLLRNGEPDYSLKSGTLTLTIPYEYQKLGRKYALIALIKGGEAIVLYDTDTNPTTISVNLNHEGYAFRLIYID